MSEQLAPDLVPDLDAARALVGARVLIKRGAQHRHPSRYGGYVGLFCGERAQTVVDAVHDQDLGDCVVYELPQCRPPFYQEERERWLVPVDGVVEILDPVQDERRRLSGLASS